MAPHQYDRVVWLQRGGGGGVGFFGGEEGRCECCACGTDARDVAVGFGEVGCEGGAEVGRCDEEIVG